MVQMVQKINHSDKTETGQGQNKGEKPKSLEQIKAEFIEQVREQIDETEFASEGERMQFEKKIEQKIRSGAKLSAKEMNYLRKYNPYLYQQMSRVQAQREMLKEELKHCKTKQEAQAVIARAMASVSKEDPAREAMTAMILNVSEQFCSSEEYQKLPDTQADLEREKKSQKSSGNPFKEDEESEAEEEISYSVNLSGYQEATVAFGSETGVFEAGA